MGVIRPTQSESESQGRRTGSKVFRASSDFNVAIVYMETVISNFKEFQTEFYTFYLFSNGYLSTWKFQSKYFHINFG